MEYLETTALIVRRHLYNKYAMSGIGAFVTVVITFSSTRGL